MPRPLPRDIDRTVAAAEPQRAAALSELRAQRIALLTVLAVVVVSLGLGRQAIGVYAAITGVRIEVGIEIRWQPKGDRAVACIDAPIRLQRAAVENVETNGAVTGPDVDGVEATSQFD